MTGAGPGRSDVPGLVLSRRLRRWYDEGLPAAVSGEARRCLLNATAAGIGGSRNSALRRLLDAVSGVQGTGGAPVLAHVARTSPEAAALVNAFAVTQDDFDDAHVPTIVHPGAAALAGVLSVCERQALSGPQLLAAFALACEAQLVVASAISPSHYGRGWHTSATCAAVGSAVAAGLCTGLPTSRLATALELAVMRVVGLREAHGTLMKGFQVGRGAANGVQAALAVRAEDELAVPPLLGVHEGFTHGLTDEPPSTFRLPSGLRDEWELLRLTYKPYPAGIVCSSGIEAALDLAPGLDVAAIHVVRLRVHPLVVELAGNTDPSDEMQARVSLPHGVAVALLEGAAGMAQFTPAAVQSPAVRRLRGLICLVPDETLPRSTAVLEVETTGEVRGRRVDDPRGGEKHPLTDEQLYQKVADLVDVMGAGAAERLIETVNELPAATDTQAFVAAACRLPERP